MSRWRTRVFVRVFPTRDALMSAVLREREHGWLFTSSFFESRRRPDAWGGRQISGPEVLHSYHARGGLVFRGPPPGHWAHELSGTVLLRGQTALQLDDNTLWVGDGRLRPGWKIGAE